MKGDPTIAERLNLAGFLVFTATVVLVMLRGSPAAPGLIPAGGLVAAAGLMILFDFRGSGRRSGYGGMIPGHPKLSRFVGGGSLLFFGATMLVMGALAVAGVVPDSGPPVGATDGP